MKTLVNSLMHRAREQEISIIFQRTPERAFARGLELGSGDCYQSRFLKRYVTELTCSDFFERVPDHSDPEITYRQCDAEQVDHVFAGRDFDLVFSSNMLPHTPNQRAVLTGAARVMADGAILIMVVPSPLWKLCKLAAFYPHLLLSFPQRIVRKLWAKQIASSERTLGKMAERTAKINNPKAPTTYSWLRRGLFPVPIGVYSSNTAEVFGSRKRIWSEKFRETGWELIAVRNGPFFCGDLNRGLNDFFAKLGFSTEYAFIAKKAGQSSRYESYFQ